MFPDLLQVWVYLRHQMPPPPLFLHLRSEEVEHRGSPLRTNQSPVTCLPLVFHPRITKFPNTLNVEDTRKAISIAFTKWSDVSPLTFTEIIDGNATADITMGSTELSTAVGPLGVGARLNCLMLRHSLFPDVCYEFVMLCSTLRGEECRPILWFYSIIRWQCFCCCTQTITAHS